MPLEKSSSQDAFHRNLKAELAAGKPLKQALAIAFSVKRKAGQCPTCGQQMPEKAMGGMDGKS